MKEDRTQGVTEARFALTLIICALVAAGYVVLFPLLGGGPSNSTTETRPEEIVVQTTQPIEEEGPRVLPVEGSGTRPKEVATRPQTTPNDGQKQPVLNPTGDAQRR